MMMMCSSRVRHALVVPSVRLAAAGALIYAAVVAAPAMAVGYPAPGGIYTPFTNCPLHNPVMRGSVGGSATGCIASINTSGTFTINGFPTPITHPVIVQFGVWSLPNPTPNQFSGGVGQPADGERVGPSPRHGPGG